MSNVILKEVDWTTDDGDTLIIKRSADIFPALRLEEVPESINTMINFLFFNNGTKVSPEDLNNDNLTEIQVYVKIKQKR